MPTLTPHIHKPPVTQNTLQVYSDLGRIQLAPTQGGYLGTPHLALESAKNPPKNDPKTGRFEH